MASTGYEPTFADIDRCLSMLTLAMAQYRDMNDRQKAILSTLVGELRSAGCSWEVIGPAAGLSPQAARKRWHLAPFPVPAPPQLLEDDDDYEAVA